MAEQREREKHIRLRFPEDAMSLEDQFREVFGFGPEDIPYEPTDDDPVEPGMGEDESEF
jgi:hypothetical protein